MVFLQIFDLIVYSENGDSSVTDVSFINQSIAFLLSTLLVDISMYEQVEQSFTINSI